MVTFMTCSGQFLRFLLLVFLLELASRDTARVATLSHLILAEKLLLKIAKTLLEIFENTHTKPREILEFKMNKLEHNCNRF